MLRWRRQLRMGTEATLGFLRTGWLGVRQIRWTCGNSAQSAWKPWLKALGWWSVLAIMGASFNITA
eukprot:6774606-Alexandrium_andersonii.AAC.1